MMYQEQIAKEKLETYYREAQTYRFVSEKLRQRFAQYLRSLALRLEGERPSKVGSTLGKPQAY